MSLAAAVRRLVLAVATIGSALTVSCASGALDGRGPAPAPDTEAGVRGTTAYVVGVTDGDTITVEIGSTTEKVRLIGINAPEARECFSRQATGALEALVEGERVRLVTDVSDRDRYGRLLRYVVLDGDDVNARLVREGFAIARRYPPDTARAEQLATAQQQARAAGAGMWGADGCVSDRGDAGLSLDVQADAPGDDNTNLNGEWLEIRNDGTAPLDLSGWTVKDESASHRYTFAEGTQLPAQAGLRLFTGCGEDSATERYWCERTSAVWDNARDTAFLLDPSGRTVTRHSYG